MMNAICPQGDKQCCKAAHELFAKNKFTLQEFGPVNDFSGFNDCGRRLASRVERWLLEKYDGKILHMLKEIASDGSDQPASRDRMLVFFPFAFQRIVKEAKEKRKIRGAVR